MKIYIVAIDYGPTFMPLYFFHSFQEAQDNVGNHCILRMELGKIGYSIYIDRDVWASYHTFDGYELHVD